MSWDAELTVLTTRIAGGRAMREHPPGPGKIMAGKFSFWGFFDNRFAPPTRSLEFTWIDIGFSELPATGRHVPTLRLLMAADLAESVEREVTYGDRHPIPDRTTILSGI
ncbi:hypothetical protein HS041_29620 [Planomonospora sp. ID67723]|uniref:hypothetical protein n=1 Tax=Planomonospora sp. ID67723 TaxID=2738134 RepID=UPI0018C426C3|nr:hypothetical protein [Planomonospora sp. ID67723]MBG0831873.1 hypothetical protein [Planomonospora sp. ID67723]